MPALRELQRAVRRSLLERDDADAAAYVRADALERLGIHRNTFVRSVTNALRLSYPAIHGLVGAEFFEGAAQVFIEAQPPRGAYLDEYGAGFADFLARFPAAGSVPYLPDVARLEWAVTRALHAPDATPIEIASLLELGQGDHNRVCFVPHPSVRLVRASYPVDTIWRAALERDDAALGAIDLGDAPVWLLVQRLPSGVDVGRWREPAWRCTAELCAGRALRSVIDLAPAIDVSALLAEHLAAGRFIAFVLAEPAAPPKAESRP